MDVIRSEIVHGVGIIWQDGQPIVLAGPDVCDEDIAECTKALLPRRQWVDLHHRLFGGLSPRALLGAVLGGAAIAIVMAAVVMGMVWTVVWDDPGIGPPPGAGGTVPAAITPSSSTPGAVPSTTRPPRTSVKAAHWQAPTVPTQASPTTPPASTVPSTTTGQKLGPVVRDAVHQAQQTVKTARPQVSSTVSSIVDDVESTASSVVCLALCLPG